MTKVENSQRNPMRNVAYVFLIIFLVVATIAVIAGVYLGYTAVKGVQSVSDPIGDLVRQLVVETSPVILPNPVVIVEEINSLARLETAEYSFQDILQIERNQELLWGVFGESLLFVAYGDVIAGVDEGHRVRVTDYDSIAVNQIGANPRFGVDCSSPA